MVMTLNGCRRSMQLSDTVADSVPHPDCAGPTASQAIRLPLPRPLFGHRGSLAVLASTAVAGLFFAASFLVCFTTSFACVHALSSSDLRWLFRLLGHLGCESAGHSTDMAIPV